jgi:ribonuclease HII
MTNVTPALDLEQALWAKSVTAVAGLDEAGRGAWAGPVVAGAVILPADRDDLAEALEGVRDSKACSAAQREALFPVVEEIARAHAVGVATCREVEQYNVVGATRLAMMRALESLPLQAAALLIDGRTLRLPRVNLPQQSMSRGEDRSLSIAAASILAKVTRDRMMVEYEDQHPGYGFAQHKGYGTAQHWQALLEQGPCDIHRRTYAPVRERLFDDDVLGAAAR